MTSKNNSQVSRRANGNNAVGTSKVDRNHPRPPTNVSSMQQNAPDVREIRIALMGGTGTGKSSLINLASNSRLRVGTGLESCTEDVQLSRTFEIDGHSATLIDTPGFDDSSHSDADILNLVSTFLATEHMNGRTLSGVIYMHRISDTRMGGVSRRNFNMFQKLCGSEALKNVVIVTSRWDEVDPAIGNAREQELKTKANFFKPAMDAGAKMMRHDRTKSSAQAIVRAFFNNVPTALLVQVEMAEEGKNVLATAAGLELHRQLMEQAEKNKRELQGLQDELDTMGEVDSDETRQELEETRQSLLDGMTRLQEEVKKLSGNRGYSERADLSPTKPARKYTEPQKPKSHRAAATNSWLGIVLNKVLSGLTTLAGTFSPRRNRY